MAAKTRIDAVVFDLGGVLVRIARGWNDAHRLAGLDPDHPMLESDNFHPRSADAAHAYQTGAMSFDDWAEAVSAASDGSYSPDDAKRIIEAWTIEEYPDIREVIDCIHDAGLVTAALSNTNARHWELLGANDQSYTDYPNLGAIQQLHASHLLGHAKPHRDIYEAFTEAADLGKARVLFFEDTKPNVDAARRYGWSARHIDYTNDPAAQMLGALRHHRIIE
jgi:HAD superfamily hydrolase (TIGR01509 family)